MHIAPYMEEERKLGGWDNKVQFRIVDLGEILALRDDESRVVYAPFRDEHNKRTFCVFGPMSDDGNGKRFRTLTVKKGEAETADDPQ